jgi:UDP:flavonoid glycosyltransferase YjiC (YdhE family)
MSFQPVSPNTRVFDYLPGDVVCRKALLVVCNGGSPTTNQALAKGVPVIGIAQNMDQFLNMQAVEAFGAGLLVRADQVDSASLSSAVAALIQRRSFRDRAGELAASVSAEGGAALLARHLQRLARC